VVLVAHWDILLLFRPVEFQRRRLLPDLLARL